MTCLASYVLVYITISNGLGELMQLRIEPDNGGVRLQLLLYSSDHCKIDRTRGGREQRS